VCVFEARSASKTPQKKIADHAAEHPEPVEGQAKSVALGRGTTQVRDSYSEKTVSKNS
jgi:hypothetical protein